MSPKPPEPPNRPSISLSSLITPFLTLILGIFLAKLHSRHLDHLTTPIISLLPECSPSTICPFFYRRSRLPSGRPATRLFDVPRRHLHSNYSALSSISPPTTIVHQWSHPRVVVFDGGFDELVHLLIKQTNGTFKSTTVVTDDNKQVSDNNRKSDSAFLSPHRDNLHLNRLTDQLVRLVGLPNRQYSEVIEINRYNETGFFAIHYDFLSESALMDKGPFHGCQRIATAVLQLTDLEGGETVFVKDQNFKGGFDALDHSSDDVLVVPTKKGRLLVWFNVHPDSEELDKTTWHGSMPVKKGQKIAATFYLRNCSQAENSRRRAQLEDFMKNDPSPSASVGEAKKKKTIFDDLDDLDDLDDDEDDEDADEEEDYFDAKEDAAYLQQLRKYREIRDADGNSTEALINAGYDPEDFEDYDREVLIMEDLDEKMEKEKELERLRLYKKIKEEDGNLVEKLKKAGFDEKEFKVLDKELDLFKDELEKDDEDEDSNQGEDEDISMQNTTDQHVGGAGGGQEVLDEELGDEKDHLQAERELGMDEQSIRAFRQELREQGLEDDDEEEMDDDEEEEDYGQDAGTLLDDGEIEMDEESLRIFKQRLLEEELAYSDDDDDDDDEEEYEDDEDDEDDEDGQCGGDDWEDHMDRNVGFEEEEYEGDEIWDDGDEEWDTERWAKVIPPGSVADGVGFG